MKINGFRGMGYLLAAVVFVAGLPVPAHADAAYADYQTLTRGLEQLARSHRELVQLQSIGETGQGRKIWMLQIAAEGPVSPDMRPAVFVAANLEGAHLAGGVLALAAVEQLLQDYATDADVKARLQTTTIYVLPRVSPDAAEAMFAQVQSGRRSNATPYDDDNDGRIDEDGAEDLNGDGWITAMRVPDADGHYLIDADDPRLMRKADPLKGERGTHTLYWEGIDNDGDGFYNEDPAGGVDIGRNFQHDYPYYQVDAGRHMVSEPEARAVMDFLLAHRNVAAMVVFDASDNLIAAPDKQGELAPAREIDLHNFVAQANARVHERRSPPPLPKAPPDTVRASPPGGGRPRPRVPATVINAADRAYFSSVSERYRELTGIKDAPAVRAPHGALFEFGYFQFGIPAFATPGWGLPETDKPLPPTADAAEAQRAGRPQNRAPVAVDAALLQWFEEQGIDGFVPWTAHRHPSLGEVEIGGFKPYAAANPPAAVLQALAPAHARFILDLAGRLPQIRVAGLEAKAQGGGLFRIEAEIENDGFFPTALAHGVASRTVKPVVVQIDLAPEDVVAGEAKTSFMPALAGSGGRQRYEWIVRGRRGQKVSVKVQAQKGGTVTETVTLP